LFISYDDSNKKTLLTDIEINSQDVRLNLTSGTQMDRITEPTPAPDFAATQRALDNARESFNATVTAEAKRVQNMATATEQAHIGRLNESEYNVAMADVTSKIQQLNYEDELHQQVISHTVRMQAVELERRGTYLDAMNVINLIWASAWRFLVLVIVVAFCGFVGWRVYNSYEDERWETKERLEAELERIRRAEEYERTAIEKAQLIADLTIFFRDALKVNGADNSKLPTNTQMDGWNADGWQEIVDKLKQLRLVVTVRGGIATEQGTYLTGGETIGTFLDCLKAGEIPSPTPLADAAKKRYIERMRSEQNANRYG